MNPRTLNTAREYFSGGAKMELTSCSELQRKILLCFRIMSYQIQGDEHEGWGVIYDFDLSKMKDVMCEELNVKKEEVNEDGVKKWVLQSLPHDITIEHPEPDPDPENNIGIEDIDSLQIPDKYIPKEWYE